MVNNFLFLVTIIMLFLSVCLGKPNFVFVCLFLVQSICNACCDSLSVSLCPNVYVTNCRNSTINVIKMNSIKSFPDSLNSSPCVRHAYLKHCVEGQRVLVWFRLHVIRLSCLTIFWWLLTQIAAPDSSSITPLCMYALKINCYLTITRTFMLIMNFG